MKKDIINFIKNKNFSDFILKSWGWPGPLRSRGLAFYGFYRGSFSFSDLFFLMLPARYKNKKLRNKLGHFINCEIKRVISEFLNDDNSIFLFDKKFYQPFDSTTELFDLVYQVVGLDQYNAKKLLTSDAVILDAGANIGTFSVFASNLAPDGVVYSFEPARETFTLLKKNTQEYSNIHCYNYGLGERKEQKKLFTYGDSTGGSVLGDSEVFDHRIKEDFVNSEIVSITTIDDFVKENRLERVDFIKMDTEGYEAQILRGARETIKRFRPTMVVSSYHNKGDRVLLPQIVKSIDSTYKYQIENIFEEDLTFFVDKIIK